MKDIFGGSSTQLRALDKVAAELSLMVRTRPYELTPTILGPPKRSHCLMDHSTPTTDRQRAVLAVAGSVRSIETYFISQSSHHTRLRPSRLSQSRQGSSFYHCAREKRRRRKPKLAVRMSVVVVVGVLMVCGIAFCLACIQYMYTNQTHSPHTGSPWL